MMNFNPNAMFFFLSQTFDDGNILHRCERPTSNEWHDQNKRWNNNKNKPALKVFQKKDWTTQITNFLGLKFSWMLLWIHVKKAIIEIHFSKSYAMRKFGNEWIKQHLNVKFEIFKPAVVNEKLLSHSCHQFKHHKLFAKPGECSDRVLGFQHFI